MQPVVQTNSQGNGWLSLYLRQQVLIVWLFGCQPTLLTSPVPPTASHIRTLSMINCVCAFERIVQINFDEVA